MITVTRALTATPLAAQSAATNLALYQGDDAAFEVAVVDDAGAPMDAALWTWAAQIRRTTADADAGGAPVCTFTATVEDTVVRLVLSRTQSVLLTESSYRWDLQGTEVGTGWVTTFTAGGVWVTPEVTRP